MTYRALALGLVLLVLVGCQRVADSLAPYGGPVPDLGRLAGEYAGEARYARGTSGCLQRMEMTMTVANGRVSGRIRDAARQDSTWSSFEGPIDYEAGFVTSVWIGGEPLIMRGRFLADRFGGEIAPTDQATATTSQGGFTNLRFGGFQPCIYLVRVPRRTAS